MFLLKSLFLNLSDISGISATNKAHITSTKTLSTYSFKIYFENKGWCSSINGNDAMRIAFAGVGKPIKLSAWRVSVLNLASLSAEKTDIKKAIKFK